MKSSKTRIIEIVSNVVIILVALIVGVVFLKTYYFTKHVPSIIRPAIGTALDIGGEDFSSNNNTLIFALQEGCHYCAESAPFYRQIIEQAAHRSDLHLVALLPDNNRPQYIQDLQLNIGDIKLVKFSTYRIGATPMLMFVNREGKITNIWIGKLEPSIEAEVMAALASTCDQCTPDHRK